MIVDLCPWCDNESHTVKRNERVNRHCKCNDARTSTCPSDEVNRVCPDCGAWDGVAEW